MVSSWWQISLREQPLICYDHSFEKLYVLKFSSNVSFQYCCPYYCPHTSLTKVYTGTTFYRKIVPLKTVKTALCIIRFWAKKFLKICFWNLSELSLKNKLKKNLISVCVFRISNYICSNILCQAREVASLSLACHAV